MDDIRAHEEAYRTGLTPRGQGRPIAPDEVLVAVEMARAAGVKIVQIIGYRTGNYTRVPNAGRLYAWNWDNLKKLLS